MSITKIANLAGVSHTTVARVINNTGKVKPATANKIRQIMNQIGYKPKPAYLRPGPHRKHIYGVKTGNVAFLASARGIRLSNESPIMAEVMHAISDELINFGMSMIQGAIDKERPLPPLVARGEVDGLFVFNDLTSADDATREFLRKYNIIYLMSSEDDIPGDRVCPDNVAVGKMAAEYLLKNGCKDIVYLNPRQRRFISAWANRWDMFNNIASQANARAREVVLDTADQVTNIGNPEVIRQLNEFVDEYFVNNHPIDGIFAGYDILTAMLYPILQARGIKIGQQVHIVSCNNEISLLAGLEPKPARIDLQPKLIGKYAVEQLIERIQKPDDQRKLVINVQPLLIE